MGNDNSGPACSLPACYNRPVLGRQADRYVFGDYAVEVVDWLDHHHWHGGDEYRDLETTLRRSRRDVALRSVGFLIDEDEKQVVLSQEQRGDVNQEGPEFATTQTILKALIVKRVRLEEVKDGS